MTTYNVSKAELDETANAVRLCKVVTGAGTISSVMDLRRTQAIPRGWIVI